MIEGVCEGEREKGKKQRKERKEFTEEREGGVGERLTYRDGDCEENAGEDPCPLKQRREREEEREAKRKGQNKGFCSVGFGEATSGSEEDEESNELSSLFLRMASRGRLELEGR